MIFMFNRDIKVLAFLPEGAISEFIEKWGLVFEIVISQLLSLTE